MLLEKGSQKGEAVVVGVGVGVGVGGDESGDEALRTCCEFHYSWGVVLHILLSCFLFLFDLFKFVYNNKNNNIYKGSMIGWERIGIGLGMLMLW